MADTAAQSVTEDTFQQRPDAQTAVTAAGQPAAIQLAATRVAHGAAFLALIGPDAVANTAAAAFLKAELEAKAMVVLSVVRGDSDGIRLTTLAAQLLDMPEATFDTDDIERLFDVLTDSASSGRPVALIIDGAEALKQDAVNYLRLLSTLASSAAPRIIFVGQAGFWQAAAALKHLVEAHWTLPQADTTAPLPPEPAAPDVPVWARGVRANTMQANTMQASAMQASTARASAMRAGTFAIPRMESTVRAAEAPVAGNPALVSMPLLDDRFEQPNLLRLAPEMLITGSTNAPATRRRGWPLYAALMVGMCVLIFGATEAVRRLDLPAPLRARLASYLPPRLAAGIGLALPKPIEKDVTAKDHPASDAAASTTTVATAQPTAANRVAANPVPVYSPPRAEPKTPATALFAASEQPPADAALPVASQAGPSTPLDVDHAPLTAAPTATERSATPLATILATPPAIQFATPLAIQMAAPPGNPLGIRSVAPVKVPTATGMAVALTPPVAAPVDPARRGAPAQQPPIALQPDLSNIQVLLSRGDKSLALGDLTAARLFYERAASLGSGRGATSVGRTYDPVFLAAIMANGPRADTGIARTWYQTGVTLGDPEATLLLHRLGSSEDAK